MSQSNVYLLQPKTISYLEKTKTSLRSLNLSLLPLVFPPIFHKEEYNSLSLSLSLSLSQNFTKSSQDLFAISSIGERVLDLDEFDASGCAKSSSNGSIFDVVFGITTIFTFYLQDIHSLHSP